MIPESEWKFPSAPRQVPSETLPSSATHYAILQLPIFHFQEAESEECENCEVMTMNFMHQPIEDANSNDENDVDEETASGNCWYYR